jgi:hypothetical protein
MEPIVNYHQEVGILGVFDIPLRASLEVVLVGFNLGLKLGNPLLEVPLLFNMVLLPNSDGTDQRGGNPTEGNHVDVSFYGEGGGNRTGGTEAFERGFLYLWFWKRERVRGHGA